MRKILVIDTSILCVWLGIPGKDTCGPVHDRWDKKRVKKIIREEEKFGTMFVLPLATLIETGNHIAQAADRRFEQAQKLTDYLVKAVDGKIPWAPFTNQSVLCDEAGLRKLAAEWPPLAAKKLTIGDATIKQVAEYYARIGRYEVEIFTGDGGLKHYQPSRPPLTPRRRRTSC
ncbi:MAG: hypothetical protein GY862_31480 [Gammaproteobacteria bacterium]|nr:hypothetical protein [Gammaproteobacteria bacterium]